MKPHVICHMTASIDGKTLLSRWKPEGRVAAGLFERLHDELDGDAWLVGRVTGQEFAKGNAYSASASERVPRQAWFARRDAKAYGVVLIPWPLMSNTDSRVIDRRGCCCIA